MSDFIFYHENTKGGKHETSFPYSSFFVFSSFRAFVIGFLIFNRVFQLLFHLSKSCQTISNNASAGFYTSRLRLRLRPASQFTVYGCAWVLPCEARGEAWVISPEFLLSNFPAFLSLKTGSTLRSDKFQAVNGYHQINPF